MSKNLCQLRVTQITQAPENGHQRLPVLPQGRATRAHSQAPETARHSTAARPRQEMSGCSHPVHNGAAEID